MPDDEAQAKDLEALSRAIRNAILKSDEVKRMLIRLHRQRLVGQESFLALVLPMADLIELVEGPPEPLQRRTQRRRRRTRDPRIVDGRKLSASELAFLEFCEKQFDEEAWLRHLRLKFE